MLFATPRGVTRIRSADYKAMHADLAKPKHNKYGARKTVVDGITFSSAKEAAEYGKLKLAERAGEISGLELQPKYDLVVNGVKVGRYKPDFRFTEKGQIVVVEVKGYAARDYPLRKKMFKALFPNVQHREV